MATIGINLNSFPVERRGNEDFMVARLETGGKEIVVTMRRPVDAKSFMVFTPKTIDFGDRRVWEFEKEREAGFNGHVRLEEVGGELVLVYLRYLGKTRFAIERTVPVSDFIRSIVIKDRHTGVKRRVGGSSAEKLLKLKMNSAIVLRDMKPEIIYTADEQDILDRRREEAEEKRRLEEEARQKKLEEERRIREEKITAIYLRDRIKVYDSEGREFTGVPVLEGEWLILRDKARAIVVEKFEDDQPLNPLEFIEVKRNGRPKKVVLAENLSLDNPKSQELEADILMLLVDGEEREVVYFTREQIERVKADGVNLEGVLVATGKTDSQNRFAVSQFTADGKLEFVGQYSEVEK